MLTTTAQEPKKARFTSDNVLIKDHYYFHGNEISWNRPAAINDKYYPYYHQQKDEHKEKIEEMHNLEHRDKSLVEQVRRDRILEKKAVTKATYEQRVKERILIQNKSLQAVKSLPNLDFSENIEEETADVIAKRIDASKHTRTNDFSWNHLNKASKKYVDQYLRPICVEREEEMVANFHKKIDKENKIEEQKRAEKAEFRKAIRQVFLKKHEENYDREKNVVMPPGSLTSINQTRTTKETLPSIQVLDNEGHCTNFNYGSPSLQIPSLMSMDGEFKLKYATSMPNLDDTCSQHSRSLSKLAEPKNKHKKDRTVDYSELKGTLIKNMDEKSYHNGNNFYDALAAKSRFFLETAVESRETCKKPTSITSLNSIQLPPHIHRVNKPVSKSKISGVYKSLNELEEYNSLPKSTKNVTIKTEKDEIYSDIAAFENHMSLVNTTKSGGYSRSELVLAPFPKLKSQIRAEC